VDIRSLNTMQSLRTRRRHLEVHGRSAVVQDCQATAQGVVGVRLVSPMANGEVWHAVQAATSKYVCDKNLRRLYLVMQIPEDAVNVMEVHVQVESHDQGWAAPKGIFSWGELTTLDAAGQPSSDPVAVYSNHPEDWEWTTRQTTLLKSTNPGFVEQIKAGTRIGLWLHSQDPGVNYVKSAMLTAWFQVAPRA